MAAGTLYTYPKNFRAYKVLIAAQYSGADVKVDANFKFGDTNKSSAFLAKFPLGKVPAFESKDGLCVFESNAIAHFVGNRQLLGETPESAALVQQWVNFGDNEILPAACTWVFPCLGITQFNKQDTERAKEQITRVLKILNDYLLTRTYVVGEQITLADISLCCNLLLLFEHVLDPEFRKPFQNVTRWFLTLVNQPQFKTVIGDVTLTSKMAQFDAKKYAECHGQGAQGDKKKEKKEKQEKQPKPPKQEQKKEEPEEEDLEEEKPREPKDPFSAYPKGTFDMDEWKRTYSNNDTLTVALPYFWNKFDKENYSIWYCEYTEDLSSNITFMTCNLVSGMFQRLDKMRKNAFGSMCIFGQNYENQICGVWVWRTHELAFKLNPDWQVDYESYSWKKLDPDAPETKKLVQEYFAHEGDFDGKKFVEGKVFK